jgi:putative CocE/NonD family hydrolase
MRRWKWKAFSKSTEQRVRAANFAQIGASIMMTLRVCRALLLVCGAAFSLAVHAAEPTLTSEMPGSFAPKTDSFDYIKREVMIPMRDGVRLHTVIFIPKSAHRAPILLTRTPYGASQRFRISSAHLDEVMDSSDVADDAVVHGNYIRVIQDVRGKYGSEGNYVMNRPEIGPLNSTTVDHSTDTYDTIDWLVKNTPESNGKVGILGISYDGFTSLMALFHPHPALKAAVPINAMVDGWMGDDWFHHGAFRQSSLEYAHDQEATRDSHIKWWSDHYDDYETWLAAGSAGHMAELHGLDTIGFAIKLLTHPAYDAFWQDQAVDKLLAQEKLQVPVMLVHSLWDQEDIYGNLAVYKALKPKDVDGDKVFLVMGPWFHHQQRLDGSAVGNIAFGSDTSAYFRLHLLRPFLDHFLQDDAPPLAIAPVETFETGTNVWREMKTWLPNCSDDCRVKHVNFYLQPGGVLGAAAQPGFESYVSDPAKPVPYLPRPIHIEDDGGASWQTWLTSDQRDVASRPDVISYVSPVLTAPLKVSGEPLAELSVSTSGTDGDFVVKLIDVYPDEVGRDPKMGGYQLMISSDIMRARYRNDPAVPEAMPADKPQRILLPLPAANHVFLPGHRMMVQVQSSWFPLYDRNPQKFVPNIFFAKPKDYQKATIKIFGESFVNVPVEKK